MSKRDKHTPLSAEELFKLLEEKNAGSFSVEEGLDDFEKEALEGFSAHVTVDKAKQLTKELNEEISKKVGEDKKGTGNPKVIWFSAAASIVLIIMLSVFFLHKAKNSDSAELALNESSSPKKMMETIVDQAPLQPANAKVPAEKKTEAFETKTKNSEITEGKGAVYKEQETMVAANKNQDQERTPLSQNIQTSYAAEVVKEKMAPVNSGSSSTMGDYTMNSGNGLAQKATGVTSTAPALAEEATVMVAREKAEYKKMKKKEEKNTEDGDNNAKDKSAMLGVKADAAGAGFVEAVYKGEKTIKEYVTERMKTKHNTTFPSGTVYKVTLTVFENGSVKVKTISSTSEEGKKRLVPLTDVLNEMKGWTPALMNHTTINSDIYIELGF